MIGSSRRPSQIAKSTAASVLIACDGVSEDLSKFMYHLANKQTDSVIGPMLADGDDSDMALKLEYHEQHLLCHKIAIAY